MGIWNPLRFMTIPYHSDQWEFLYPSTYKREIRNYLPPTLPMFHSVFHWESSLASSQPPLQCRGFFILSQKVKIVSCDASQAVSPSKEVGHESCGTEAPRVWPMLGVNFPLRRYIATHVLVEFFGRISFISKSWKMSHVQQPSIIAQKLQNTMKTIPT